MLYPTEISFDYSGKVTVYYSVDIDEKIACNQSDVMQFTGLKDKNGKEIYEGDVIRGEGGNLPVEWRNGFYMVRPDKTAFDLVDGYEIDIIGNIYENPGLLKT
jgi:hypothetical protein